MYPDITSKVSPVKINILFLMTEKKNHKGGGSFLGFFNTEKITIDHVYNEQTETV